MNEVGLSLKNVRIRECEVAKHIAATFGYMIHNITLEIIHRLRSQNFSALAFPTILKILLCILQSLLYQVHVALWRRAARFRFLLKRVQYINNFRKSDSIDGSIRVSVKILDNFQLASAAHVLERFRCTVFTAQLGGVQSNSYNDPYLFRECAKIVA
jgi:hypothetical protein